MAPTFDETLPKDNDKSLYLWIQDGWQTDEKSVIAEASRRPRIIHAVRLSPRTKQNRTGQHHRCAGSGENYATKERQPIDRGEGRDAQRSMESRNVYGGKRAGGLLDNLFSKHSRVSVGRWARSHRRD